MSSAAQQRDIGRFGNYRLIDRIAVGGMAEIFLAHQQDEHGRETPVVIKRIRPHLSKHSAFVKMFLNEARLAAQLNHPHIVQIHDLGKIADSYFIAMEYVPGRDMRRVVPKAEGLGIPFPLVYAVKIASQVCAGLHYAHTKVGLHGEALNIVHRDVSPENIIVAFDGSVKVLDFGIAKAANQVGQTRTGEVQGKVSYMSPEQCLGKPLDCRSDIFSLGVVLYEWLTGFKLFTGESEMLVMRSITEGKIYAPSYFREDLPERVEAILMKALERDRDKRYQTAAQMQKDLDAFLEAYEFTPTPLHLSNFIKQLFEDELMAEQRRASARASDPTSTEALELADVVAALGGASAGAELEIPPPPVPTSRLGKFDPRPTEQIPAVTQESLRSAAPPSRKETRPELPAVAPPRAQQVPESRASLLASRAETPLAMPRAEATGVPPRAEAPGAAPRAEATGAPPRAEVPAATSRAESQPAAARAEASGASVRGESPAAAPRAEAPVGASRAESPATASRAEDPVGASWAEAYVPTARVEALDAASRSGAPATASRAERPAPAPRSEPSSDIPWVDAVVPVSLVEPAFPTASVPLLRDESLPSLPELQGREENTDPRATPLPSTPGEETSAASQPLARDEHTTDPRGTPLSSTPEEAPPSAAPQAKRDERTDPRTLPFGAAETVVQPMPAIAPPPPAAREEHTDPRALALGSSRDEHTEPRMLAVPLSPAVFEALESVARRNDVNAGRLVAELLEVWLKYR